MPYQECCIVCRGPVYPDHGLRMCKNTNTWGLKCRCGFAWHAPPTPGTAVACPQCGNKHSFTFVGNLYD